MTDYETLLTFVELNDYQNKPFHEVIELYDKEIKDYHYTMQVPVSHECTLALYKGASKTPFYTGIFQKDNRNQINLLASFDFSKECENAKL